MMINAIAVETPAPNNRLIAMPLKIGSSIMAKAPAINVNEVIKMGRIRSSAPLMAASVTSFPFATSSFTNSTIRIDCRTMIPPSAIMPIIEVAVNSAPMIQWPGTIPIIVTGIGDMISPARAKFLNSQTIRL